MAGMVYGGLKLLPILKVGTKVPTFVLKWGGNDYLR